MQINGFARNKFERINLRNRGILDRKRKRRYNISSYYQFVGKDEILKSAKKKTSLKIVKRKVKDRIKRKKKTMK